MGFLAGRTKVVPSLRIYLPPTAALGAPGTPLRGMRIGRQAPFASDLRRGRTANRGGLLGKVLARRSALRVAPLSEDGVDMEGTERAACERGGPGQCRLVRRPRSSAASGRGVPQRPGWVARSLHPAGRWKGMVGAGRMMPDTESRPSSTSGGRGGPWGGRGGHGLRGMLPRPLLRCCLGSRSGRPKSGLLHRLRLDVGRAGDGYGGSPGIRAAREGVSAAGS